MFVCRYGTTVTILPPHEVLYAGIMSNEPKLIANAIASPQPPKVIVVPTEGLERELMKDFLQKAGLWKL